ncbi:TerB family tellurite resistance protein [Bacillus xiapuensis]|uniref:TerB family tellurite resistance protein n=1 Tax=Bacillus xiapuensis TaxID=2014075 RepID=A0ABU6NCS4_9BACI|nr:TerB family tellurite resistance protein [Bacillus xiapuensis]
MFLAELALEEREAFLELANLIAVIDGNRSVFEDSILNKYQKEMDLEEYQLKDLTLEEILKKFKSERAKNIVLTELFQLIYADGVFHNQESGSIKKIKEHFGFDSNEFSSFKDWIDKIKELSV